MAKVLLRIALLSLLAIVGFLAVKQPPQNYYPVIEIEMSDPADMLTVFFLLKPRLRQSECEAINGNIGRVSIESCPQCRITKLNCKTSLKESERVLLSEAPLPMPSGRMPDGIIVFNSSNQNLSMAACQTSETQSASGPNPIKCLASNTVRVEPLPPPIFRLQHLILLLTAFAIAWIICWLIIRYEHLHAHFSHDHTTGGPQKYHAQPTPRIGGVAIFLGLVTAGGTMAFDDALISEYTFGLLLMAGIPAFFGGLAEDATKKVGVLERLLLTMLSGACAAWLLGAVINRLDVPAIDHALVWIPLAVIFTIFAVGGVANSINIIDGYNGLASGFAIIVLIAMAYVANAVGDRLILSTSLALAGALLGFLVWNWPSGKIFLGDGGAYLVGFILAELSVLIVVRNPAVSPWFPLLLLAYPIFETLYSIYRRKLKHDLSPGQPDNQHLHQLIHDNMLRREIHHCVSRTNHCVAKYLWIPAIATAVLACAFWQSTMALASLTILYCVLYVISYRRIAQPIGMPNPDISPDRP